MLTLTGTIRAVTTLGGGVNRKTGEAVPVRPVLQIEGIDNRGLAQLHTLIHTTNSPNPVSMRVPGRFVVSFQDPEGLPLGTFLELLKGPLSPLEFMLVRRYANATTKH